MQKQLKTAGAFLLSALLVYWGFDRILTGEQRRLLLSIPLQTLIPSLLLAIPSYLMGGIELRYMYLKVGRIRLSAYDTLTLPFVINLWGFIIPFQGSFIYTLAYVLAKYKQNVAHSFRVYLLSFSMSMAVAGIIGFGYGQFSNHALSGPFRIFCLLLFLNPALLLSASRIMKNHESRNFKPLNPILGKISRLISSEKIDPPLILNLLLLKLAGIVLTGLWLYWVALRLKINLTLLQLILLILLMNITTLFKLTPGNLGVNQFAAGGLAVLVGGSMNDGFMLSSFQFLTNIIIAVVLGGGFSIVNFKSLSWKALKTAIIEKRRGEKAVERGQK